MNWLTNYVRPRIRALVARDRADVPEDLWTQCSACERMIFHRDLESNQHVCPLCGHHMRVSPLFRFEQLFDPESWQTIELPTGTLDPLKFRDRKKYTDRHREAQARTASADAVQAAHGLIDGRHAVIAVVDFAFMAGSMGTAVGEGLVRAAKLAVLQQAAFIVVTASGGARMQEGTLSLMQMARTTIGVQLVKEAKLPYVVILSDPTTGGVTASFAMLGDVAIAEPGAVVGFAGTRVIEQTIREKLPDGFQRAEYLLDHGMIDMVVHRFDLRSTVARLIGLLAPRSAAPIKPNGASAEPLPAAPPLSVVKEEKGDDAEPSD
ncbi:MAG: acetyl-CoA carboxylase, carboxyltransferase subunit beta [Geminicoccaceae bacterium]